ncbi:MAG: hypothetical protein LBJ86_06215 [Spirochaetaceae bacterium]|nr:hypothetical protein [Spirochaetaceae bacterium]
MRDITFAENRYPRKLFAYLQEVWGLTVTEVMSGIYHITGARLAIQVIYRKRLSEKENPWLKGLGADLSAEQCGRILKQSKKIGGELSAYMHVVLNANPRLMKELIGMKINPEVRKVVEEAGLLQEWLAEDRAKGEVERKRLMCEVERLKHEIATLKRKARAKA